MGATVAWIGGLFFQSTLLYPALLQDLDPAITAGLIRRLNKRFSSIAWLSLGLLIATGLTQMAAHPNYRGFLQIGDRWSLALLAKHISIGLMLALAGYQTWFLQPRLERAALRRATDEQGQLASSLRRLHLGNFALGLLVLGFTALARTA